MKFLVSLVLLVFVATSAQASFSVTCKVTADILSVTPLDEKNSWLQIVIKEADLRSGDVDGTDCMFMFNRQRNRTIPLPVTEVQEGEEIELRYEHVDTDMIDEFGQRVPPKEKWSLWGLNIEKIKRFLPWQN